MTIIRVVDLETTGLEPPEHAVIEIGWCDLEVAGLDLFGAPAQWQVGNGDSMLVAPGRDVPPQASALHHLIDDDLVDACGWGEACLLVFGTGETPIALAAHNAKFERQWCTDWATGALPWICTYKCGLRLWPDAPIHSNQGLRYWRRSAGLDRNVADRAHRAYEDAYVTAHLLRDMLNDGTTVAQLIEWSGQPALQVTCHIGKFRGTPWREVDDGFLVWVSERDFDEDVLFTVGHEMERRQAEQDALRAEQAERDDDLDDDWMPF